MNIFKRAKLRAMLRHCDYILAGTVIKQQYYDENKDTQINRMIDQFWTNPGFDEALKLIKHNELFVYYFTESCHGGLYVRKQQSESESAQASTAEPLHEHQASTAISEHVTDYDNDRHEADRLVQTEEFASAGGGVARSGGILGQTDEMLGQTNEKIEDIDKVLEQAKEKVEDKVSKLDEIDGVLGVDDNHLDQSDGIAKDNDSDLNQTAVFQFGDWGETRPGQEVARADKVTESSDSDEDPEQLAIRQSAGLIGELSEQLAIDFSNFDAVDDVGQDEDKVDLESTSAQHLSEQQLIKETQPSVEKVIDDETFEEQRSFEPDAMEMASDDRTIGEQRSFEPDAIEKTRPNMETVSAVETFEEKQSSEHVVVGRDVSELDEIEQDVSEHDSVGHDVNEQDISKPNVIEQEIIEQVIGKQDVIGHIEENHTNMKKADNESFGERRQFADPYSNDLQQADQPVHVETFRSQQPLPAADSKQEKEHERPSFSNVIQTLSIDLNTMVKQVDEYRTQLKFGASNPDQLRRWISVLEKGITEFAQAIDLLEGEKE